MPGGWQINSSDERLKTASEQAKQFLEAYPYCFFGEREHPKTATEAVDQMRSAIKYCQKDVATFTELMLGRKLTLAERLYFIHMQGTIEPIKYKPYEFDPYLGSNAMQPKIPLYYLYSRGRGNFSSVVFYDTKTMEICRPNRNMREYDINPIDDNYPAIEDFLEKLPNYYLYPVKNEPESLQPYKNIMYPWDEDFDDYDPEEIHRKEIHKSTGGKGYDFHSKSGRRNRKRSKMVQE